VSRADHPLAQAGQPFRRDTARRQPVLLEDLGQRQRGAGGCVSLLPAVAAKLAGDRFDFRACTRFGRREGLGAETAVAEETLGKAHAADLQRLQSLGIQAAADDELGGAPADVDHEPGRVRRRQDVRDAEVDEPRFLVAGDHVDREAERGLRLREELAGVGGNAEHVGRDGADRRRMEPAQALPKAGETGQRFAAGPRLDPLPRLEAGA
jgi:hypothetical protein